MFFRSAEIFFSPLGGGGGLFLKKELGEVKVYDKDSDTDICSDPVIAQFPVFLNSGHPRVTSAANTAL